MIPKKIFIFITRAMYFVMLLQASPLGWAQSLPDVRTGLDIVVADSFRVFRGKSIGLVTNHTAVDQSGVHIVELFRSASEIELRALFGPEHGIAGYAEAGDKVTHQTDASSGLQVYSLYGETRKPTPAMLAEVDALVFDMQDVGARFYTYISTMALALAAAAEADIEFYVLDRPNPIGGKVEGPVLDPRNRSFVGIYPIALRHGMTVGELARMFVGEGWIFAEPDDSSAAATPDNWHKLTVIQMSGWRRSQLFEATGLRWLAPSPNMPSPTTALLYPGMCLLEATNCSEGRGTAEPFVLIGAPWLESNELAGRLNAAFGALHASPVQFTPISIPGRASSPKFQDIVCNGLRFEVMQPEALESVKAGIALLWHLSALYPNEFKIRRSGMIRLTGAEWLVEMIEQTRPLDSIYARLDQEAMRFCRDRAPYLLYD